MPNRFSKENDLYFTSAGDYVLDSGSGDFKDTLRVKLRSLIQRITTRIQSTKGDWRLQLDVGANLMEFAGQRNTAEVGERIRRAVMAGLTSDGFLSGNELNVQVFPVSKTAVAIVVRVVPIGQIEEVYVSFTYDARDNKLVPRNL